MCPTPGAQTVSPGREPSSRTTPWDCRAPGAGSWAAAGAEAGVAVTESLRGPGTLRVPCAPGPLRPETCGTGNGSRGGSWCGRPCCTRGR